MGKAVVLVGLGGGLYNGLTGFVNWIGNQTDVERVMLIDPDTIEERNGVRQWRRNVGGDKVDEADRLMDELGLGKSSLIWNNRFEDVVGLDDELLRYEEVVVIETVDNHMCRVAVYDWVVKLAQDKLKVTYVTGGNDVEGGYAAGMVITPTEGGSIGWTEESGMNQCRFNGVGLECKGNLRLTRPDIWEEAEREARHEADVAAGQGCQMTVGEQSSMTNMMTAWCKLWLLRQGGAGEVVWNWIDGKAVVIPRIK